VALFRERAIVLRHQELSGADKVVTFLTLGRGKVKVVAKGARRPKSRFVGSLEPLSLVELVYFLQPQRDALARLNQCEVLESFDSLRDDYDRLVRGLYLMELADTLLREGVSVPGCFDNLLGALGALKDGVDGELVRWSCSWRLLNALGYSPSLSACVACRGREGLVTFNPGLGGCLCRDCQRPAGDGFALSSGARESLLRLVELPWERVGRLSLTGPMRQEVGRVVEAFLRQYLDRKLKSESLLEEG
jgi:DNA repair protein RecO (recombination protein O)